MEPMKEIQIITFASDKNDGIISELDVEIVFTHDENDGDNSDNIQNLLDKFKAFLIGMGYSPDLVKECINDFED